MNNIVLGVVALITFGTPLLAIYILFSNYYKYRKVAMANGLSGCEIAQKILKANHLDDIYIVQINGDLTDNYDVNRRVIRLSKSTFHRCDIASAVLASYVAALAIKNKNKTFMIRINNFLKPIVDILILLSYICLLVSLILHNNQYLKITIGIMFVIVIYNFLTYKINYDTKVRTSLELKKLSLVSKNELEIVNKMSAALSYLSLSSLFLIPYQLVNQLIKK